MISLTALLCPTLYARFHPRFQEAKSMFDDFKQMMRMAIDQHLVSIHTIRKVKFLCKNSIVTKLYNFLGKSKLSTAIKSKTTTFSRVFHSTIFSGNQR